MKCFSLEKHIGVHRKEADQNRATFPLNLSSNFKPVSKRVNYISKKKEEKPSHINKRSLDFIKSVSNLVEKKNLRSIDKTLVRIGSKTSSCQMESKF